MNAPKADQAALWFFVATLIALAFILGLTADKLAGIG